MMNLKTLLSLAFIGFFWACDPADNKQCTLVDLPTGCLSNICSFSFAKYKPWSFSLDDGKHELYFNQPCYVSCGKMYEVMMREYGPTMMTAIDEIIENCGLEDGGYVTTLSEMDRVKLFWKLAQAKQYIIQNSSLFCKLQGYKLPDEGDNFEIRKRLQSYQELVTKIFKEDEVISDQYDAQAEELDKKNAVQKQKIAETDLKLTELEEVIAYLQEREAVVEKIKQEDIAYFKQREAKVLELENRSRNRSSSSSSASSANSSTPSSISVGTQTDIFEWLYHSGD